MKRFFLVSFCLTSICRMSFAAQFSSDKEILTKSAVFTSLTQFQALKLSPEAQRLIVQLARDEFGSLKPFAQLPDYLPLGEILADGVLGFSRETFRSARFIWPQGYDLVRYRIETEDSGVITLLAFRSSGSPAVGEQDNRPIQVTLLAGSQVQSIEEPSEGALGIQEIDEVLQVATPMTLFAP